MWVARAVGLVGLVSVLSAASPAMSVRLRAVTEVLPSFAPDAARVATSAVGVLLLLLAGGLRRAKRRAWILAVVLAAAASLLHVVKGLDVEEATFSVAVLVLLVATRDAFMGIPDPRSGRHTAAVFAGSMALAVPAGLAIVLLDRDGQVGHPGLRAATAHVLGGLVGLPGPVAFSTARRASDVAVSLALLGGVVLLVTIASILRPADGPSPLDIHDQTRLRGLLECPGEGDSLGYFALRQDKSAMFSASGKAAVAYRVIGGVSLAAGDPLGDPEAWPGAIARWLTETARYAWTPAVLGASTAGAQAYHRAGLDALELGDEALIEVNEFTLDGRPMRTVRQAVARVRRLGYTCEVVAVSDLPDPDLTELRHSADQWREGATERGFAMALGRLGDPADTGCVIVRARRPDRTLCALLHLVPWGRHGLSLDVMRRDPAADNGVVELMVTDLLAAAPDRAITQISLNFAVFRSVFERGGRLGAGPVLRLWRRILLTASRFWQIESLYRANAKYHPLWQPRFLCFRTARDLPRVTVAALEAEAFLVPPRMIRRLTRSRRP